MASFYSELNLFFVFWVIIWYGFKLRDCIGVCILKKENRECFFSISKLFLGKYFFWLFFYLEVCDLWEKVWGNSRFCGNRLSILGGKIFNCFVIKGFLFCDWVV